ncbi:MAG: hypothetical protein LC732_04310 [Acidobacteria bacterium]|nr:hypothetical protein [Acidobacteriota bacterium]
MKAADPGTNLPSAHDHGIVESAGKNAMPETLTTVISAVSNPSGAASAPKPDAGLRLDGGTTTP